MKKVAICYVSYSGNTEELAEHIHKRLNVEQCDLFKVNRSVPDLSDYDTLFFGTFTWCNSKKTGMKGILPDETKVALQNILKEQLVTNKNVYVFGTGESTFPQFCRSVDECSYHFEQYGNHIKGTIKVEQAVRGNQEKKLNEWIELITTDKENRHDIITI